MRGGLGETLAQAGRLLKLLPELQQFALFDDAHAAWLTHAPLEFVATLAKVVDVTIELHLPLLPTRQDAVANTAELWRTLQAFL